MIYKQTLEFYIIDGKYAHLRAWRIYNFTKTSARFWHLVANGMISVDI